VVILFIRPPRGLLCLRVCFLLRIILLLPLPVMVVVTPYARRIPPETRRCQGRVSRESSGADCFKAGAGPTPSRVIHTGSTLSSLFA
jgi:hypothetical protein